MCRSEMADADTAAVVPAALDAGNDGFAAEEELPRPTLERMYKSMAARHTSH